MPYNGEANSKFGVYKAVCCGAEIVVNSGAVFPDCPNHQRLTTIWKLQEKITIQAAHKLEPDPVIEPHIGNRRLFNVAVGQLRAEAWEQKHLHGCKVCQGVLHVLVNQVIDLEKNSPKSSDAA